ncbi:serine hydrolase domain-containing protein [Dactylosporangium matsuzakiense]|uniref:Serine hydrolase n=1 Tax=Dactylosporangium matsuzakiense TaxID=53360 RepID=A0A9W6KJY6_9ACTN|nr:serine hydrolase domain-containing protein [Dactylosporangium matsuzakiense]UWZ41570.1 beta-lactamase family protein [Dactylosporangium matsuzakiense]GLL02362.1 serine hydrolase [Dactylosporangium matsuzakiense]
MASGGFSARRLVRLRDRLERLVDAGFVPGGLALLARHGAVHAEAVGRLAFDGPGSATAFGADTICRLGSLSKPVAAACLMTLVEDGTVRLDDPVDDLLPELAGMRVLTDPGGPVEDTAPAGRAIVVRDLLTYTLGTGLIPAAPGTVPIADALGAVRGPGPDAWLRQLGALPLVHQPGARWMYDTAGDVTGVLVARATGMSFGAALRERIGGPLGMADTGFSVPPADLGRLATGYDATADRVVDDPPAGRFSAPPAFESGGGGLVSTAADFLSFASALAAGGVHNGERVLSRPAVTLMTTDHLTPQQKARSGFWPGYFDDIGWGFGMSVRTRRTGLGPSAGSYGWSGYWGTAWYNDPAEDLVAVFCLQRAHAGDQRRPLWHDLWTAVYQAVDD